MKQQQKMSQQVVFRSHHSGESYLGAGSDFNVEKWFLNAGVCGCGNQSGLEESKVISSPIVVTDMASDFNCSQRSGNLNAFESLSEIQRSRVRQQSSLLRLFCWI